MGGAKSCPTICKRAIKKRANLRANLIGIHLRLVDHCLPLDPFRFSSLLFCIPAKGCCMSNLLLPHESFSLFLLKDFPLVSPRQWPPTTAGKLWPLWLIGERTKVAQL